MTARCPSCDTRTAPTATALDGGGSLAACGACGHEWIEARAVEVRGRAPAPAAFTPEAEIRRLAAARRQAQQLFRARRRRRRLLAGAWAGLALVAASPAVLAFAFPERMVSAFPATIALYDSLGREVNIYGLEIRKVEVQNLLVEGQQVLAVKGELTNVSSDMRKIPWLRLGLRTEQGAEVYTWQLDTESRPLRPGESTGFTSRIAAPPKTAHSIEIRFARADEIGSNAAP